MKSHSRRCLEAAMVVMVAAEMLPAASLGPLEKLRPAWGQLPGLTRVYGDPKFGMPLALGWNLQRVGNRDTWCVSLGVGDQIGVMELNRKEGLMEVHEIITAGPEWCLSPDGTLLFSERTDGSPWKATLELFDLASGKSLWSIEEKLCVADVAFTPDGNQIVVLQCLPVRNEGNRAVLSWHDVADGKRMRRLEMPGPFDPVGGQTGSSYIGVTNHAVYMALPADNGDGLAELKMKTEGWLVHNDSDTPERLELAAEKLEQDREDYFSLSQIRIGGPHHEYIAIYNRDVLELFRETTESPKRIYKIDITVPREGDYERDVRFSPDQSKMVVSASGDTRILSVTRTSQPELEHFETGGRLSDFTQNGRFLATFDNGGGEVRDIRTMQRPALFEKRLPPCHCCPLAAAEFVMNDTCILSSDLHSMLLWTNEGDLLAQFVSPNRETRGSCQMQCPVFVEKALKFYAVDGWDFLMWDLYEIDRLGNSPRIVGTRVFEERDKPVDVPERMNIAFDESGTRFVTGTRKRFEYRQIGKPDQSVRLKVPEDSIHLGPRRIYLLGTPPRIVASIGTDAYELDPEGRADAVEITSNWESPENKEVPFRVLGDRKHPLSLIKEKTASEAPESMSFPESWQGQAIAVLLTNRDNRWILIRHSISGHLPSLAIIDWQQRKLIRDFPLDSEFGIPTLSEDEKSMIMPMCNRTVYQFDFEKLCAGAN